jgi:predicted exporter
VVAIWLVLLGVCAWQATRVEFDGRLRSLSLIPDKLARAENDFAHTWGGARGKAVAFTRGASPEEALEANASLYDYLAAGLKTDEIVSLAPILPPASRQEASRERWAAFWQGDEGRRAVAALLDEGRALGFSEGAFEPFLRLVRHPPAINAEMLSDIGLGELVGSMIIRDGRATLAMTVLPDTPAVAALFRPEAGPPPGARLVSQSRFQEEVSAAIKHDFLRFLVLASAANITLLGVYYRDWRKALCALVPVVTGLLAMLGVMGLVGLDFNLFNVAATVLIIGLAVDYGIFMVSKLSGGYDHATDRAVLLCGLTTLAGFGALALAKHPAMHSIGVSVILGICAAVPAALLVIPALYRGRPGA